MQRDRREGAVGAVLADGTHLDDLIDRKERTLSARVHADREIFELELEKVFARAWIPVAHTSEFRDSGDYVTRYIGRDPVIVTRDFEDEYRVMLNVCTHRGGQLCRSEAGNARTHTCPFHGWSFGADGKLKGVPHERAVYGDGLDKGRLGLRQARVGVLAGIIFATWDEEAPDLGEFIGDYKWYLETMLCRTDAGLEVSGPPQRSVVEANWKIVADGFFGDAYHVLSVHNRSFADLGMIRPGDENPLYNFKASVNGHAVLGFDYEHHGLKGEPAQVFARIPPCGLPPELLGELGRNLSPEQISMLAQTPPSIAALFPSTAILMIGMGPTGATVSLRFFVPLSPDKTEIVSFSLVERDAPAEFKDRIHKSSISSFGVGGLFEADDVEVWASVQRGVQGVIGRQMAENYQASAGPEAKAAAASRPGAAYRGVSTDDNQWLFYERYFEFMGDRAW